VTKPLEGSSHIKRRTSTILKLENGVVKEIIYAKDADELKDAIEGI